MKFICDYAKVCPTVLEMVLIENIPTPLFVKTTDLNEDTFEIFIDNIFEGWNFTDTDLAEIEKIVKPYAWA